MTHPPGAKPRNNDRWDTGGRIYERDGRRFTSVTTILSDAIAKPALIGWAAKMTAEYAVAHRDATLKELKDSRFASSDEASKRGTDLHKWAERYALDPSHPMPEDTTLALMAQQWLDLIDRHSIEVQATEFTVYNQALGYAGTADSVALVDGVPTLIDIKGLALDTPLPTPTGWTTMGHVQVGDELFAADGTRCKVTGKSTVRQVLCSRIIFDDTSEIVADDDHRWSVSTNTGRAGSRRYQTHVLTTAELRSTLRHPTSGQRQHRVINAGPLVLPEVALPVHPYVLGCWLGDGKQSSGEISKPDDELFAHIAACGYEVGDNTCHTSACPTRTIYGLRTQLRLAGYLGHRSIPDAYLRASASQRLSLLQGLMDTDGTWNTARRQCSFSTTHKEVAVQVAELLVSLGQRCNVGHVWGTGFGKRVESWPVTFSPCDGLRPFRLSRKGDQLPSTGASKSGRRLVHEVRPTVTVPTQCITVDSPTSTYLCGEQMVPTHNTGKDVYPEAALQLCALSRGEYIGIHNGPALPMPEFARCVVAHVRPTFARIVPVDVGEWSWRTFRAARAISQWTEGPAKAAILPAIEGPNDGEV